MGNRTFAMIKPDAINNGHSGKILDRIINTKFKILGIKMIRMTKRQAEGFYSIHSEKPFFEDLTSFMSSGKTLVLALEKENAVESWRNTIGATNPEEAEKGTIRKDFASSLSENAVHGADSDKNALIEIGFFFSEAELISNQ
ncbi:MAG: nucleoside-diphosphate kinase [Candidatus Marinimicrobia bacterium]|nr:nucleoside-diphosphate kinase [Candidatus Neomarinimicrobiota bacterium]|tara:strand:- start:627 stop:1052 length:426 start_codon:yes stop_codon:yes gene_type:complete